MIASRGVLGASSLGERKRQGSRLKPSRCRAPPRSPAPGAEERWSEIEAAEPELRADAEARTVTRVLNRFDSSRPLARYTLTAYPSDELGYDVQGRLIERFGDTADYENWAEI